MNDIAIKIEGLGKKYKIGRKKTDSLKESLIYLFKKKNPENQRTNEFWALKDINFEVRQGEAVGIIGRNGAGKSTLLKILSRITKPTTGKFEINGRVSSLLEVGTGFHSELTGKENIFLNGTILGMKRREIKEKFDEIVAFSGVEEFIDTPVKHYSSGMKVRLAFSVAAHLEPEILIIDEVLAVGDAEFQKKCLGKMEDVAGEGRTVIFVSHNMGAIASFCNTGIVLDEGKFIIQGNIDKTINLYLKNLFENPAPVISGNAMASLKKFQLLTKKNDEWIICSSVNCLDEIKFKLIYNTSITLKNVTLSVCLNNKFNTRITSLWNNFQNQVLDLTPGDNLIEVIVPRIHVIPGEYEIILYLESKGQVIERVDGFTTITVSAPESGFIKIPEISQGLYLEDFSIIKVT